MTPMRGEQGTSELGECRNCGGRVSLAAVKCTHCGYHIPEDGIIIDILHLLLGNLLTLTVIGAIIGLPLMRRALRRLETRSTGTVAYQPS